MRVLKRTSNAASGRSHESAPLGLQPIAPTWSGTAPISSERFKRKYCYDRRAMGNACNDNRARDARRQRRRSRRAAL
jgi:hypothetical protein